MRLSDLVEVVVNNEECVLLKVKEEENVKMGLIALGCFNGKETLFRITKGAQHTATIFTGDKTCSWDWGERGHTLVSDELHKCRELMVACVEEDFGIYIGKDKAKVRQTMHIKQLEDKKNTPHNIQILYWPKRERCQIHKDGEHFKWFANVEEARHYLAERYDIQSHNVKQAPTGCIVEEYKVITA